MSDCRIDKYSSRVCERGAKCCTVRHKNMTREELIPLIPLLRDIIIEQYTSAKPVPELDHEEMTVWLDVGVQRFKIANADNQEHADWYKRMLSEAIAKIIVSDEILDLIEQALSDKWASTADYIRLGVLAVKHCPYDHADFKEIKHLVGKPLPSPPHDATTQE